MAFTGPRTPARIGFFVCAWTDAAWFEMKRTTAPVITKSMHVALEDLKLDRLYVIHSGQHRFPLSNGSWRFRWISFIRRNFDV
jgi:hypothetical protein